MKIGYARVSTIDQDLDVQITQLNQIGVDKIFSEKKSGKTLEGRLELDRCLNFAREGDTIIVCRLDRFARSMHDFCDLVRIMGEKKIGFRCLNPDMDTTGAVGELTLHILMAVAQFELALRSERQREGIAKAKAKGSYQSGRRAKTMKRIREIRAVQAREPGCNVFRINKLTGIPIRTIYRLTPGEWGPVPEKFLEGKERARMRRETSQEF